MVVEGEWRPFKGWKHFKKEDFRPWFQKHYHHDLWRDTDQINQGMTECRDCGNETIKSVGPPYKPTDLLVTLEPW